VSFPDPAGVTTLNDAQAPVVETTDVAFLHVVSPYSVTAPAEHVPVGGSQVHALHARVSAIFAS
jgi:hypothetical protein